MREKILWNPKIEKKNVQTEDAHTDNATIKSWKRRLSRSALKAYYIIY